MHGAFAKIVRRAIRVSLLPDGASDGETSDGVTVASDDDGYLKRLLLRDGRWPVA